MGGEKEREVIKRKSGRKRESIGRISKRRRDRKRQRKEDRGRNRTRKRRRGKRRRRKRTSEREEKDEWKRWIMIMSIKLEFYS